MCVRSPTLLSPRRYLVPPTIMLQPPNQHHIISSQQDLVQPTATKIRHGARRRTDLCDRPVLSPRHGRGSHCTSVGATRGRQHVFVAGLSGRDVGATAHGNPYCCLKRRTRDTARLINETRLPRRRGDAHGYSTACNRRNNAKTGRGCRGACVRDRSAAVPLRRRRTREKKKYLSRTASAAV